jgi:hypothetical protein
LGREAVSLAAQLWYEEILEQYPEFKPEFKDVPDDKNGFLQLSSFLEEFVDRSIIPAELRAMIKGREDVWDAKVFESWKSENQELFARRGASCTVCTRCAKPVRRSSACWSSRDTWTSPACTRRA